MLGRLRHPLERVVEVHVTVIDAERLQGQDDGQRRSAAPDPALDERTGDTPSDAITHGVDEPEQTSRPGHRVREGLGDDGTVLLTGALQQRIWVGRHRR